MPSDRPWKEAVSWQDNLQFQDKAGKILDGTLETLESTGVG
jgi:hypothetical protein